MIPLSRKLHRFRYTLARKQQLIFSNEQMDLVTRHLPMDTEDLRTKCGMIETQIKAYGAQILGITKAHGRDQEKFEECVAEIKAFVRGGMAGMQILNRVYTNIIKHYEMEPEMHDVLKAAGAYLDTDSGKIKRKMVKQADEFEDM